jgi:chromosome segregation ATPase
MEVIDIMNGDAFAARQFRRGTAPLAESSNQYETGFEEISVALPTEVPQPPNLSRLPNEVLHSGTVETLIAHNEDLIARLKVNLRRNALLEQQILGLEKQIAELRQLNDTLEDQVHIVRERDRIYADKHNSTSGRISELEDELRLAQRRLAESDSAYAEKKQRLEAYIRRVRRWVRPGFKRALTQIHKDNLQAREIGYQTDLMKSELAQRDIEIAELARQVAELRTFQRERERTFEKDQSNLVHKYETELGAIRKENDELSLHLSFHRDRSALLDDMTRRQADAENRAVLFERRAQDLENRLNTEVKELETTRDESRREARSVQYQLEVMRDEMRKAREENERLEGENERVNTQLESLQMLWNEAQKKIDTLDLRMQSLTQINQELSIKLKEQRNQAEIDSLELKPAQAETQASQATAAYRKIDTLLATIESGYQLSQIERIHNLNFVENKESKLNESEI